MYYISIWESNIKGNKPIITSHINLNDYLNKFNHEEKAGQKQIAHFESKDPTLFKFLNDYMLKREDKTPLTQSELVKAVEHHLKK